VKPMTIARRSPPMSVYTAGIPAEYGRTIGVIVELNTVRDTRTGLHGQADLSGGSFRHRWRFRTSAIRLGQEQRGRECRSTTPIAT
jgi:hypothetical protein